MRTAPPKSDGMSSKLPMHHAMDDDDARERRDDGRLKREDVRWKRDDAKMKRDDAKMKRDDAKMKRDDGRVKREDVREKRDDMRLKREDVDDVRLMSDDVKEKTDGDGHGHGDDEKDHTVIMNKYHIQFDEMNQIRANDDDDDAFEKEQRSPLALQSAFSVLFEREKLYMPHAHKLEGNELGIDPSSRKKAIRWLLKMQAFFNFSVHTAALSINYLDRFLTERQITNGKAWVMHLLSVACLSLAAKMEEIEVPLLLDLQVETHFFFESSTIQRMELLVLSTLGWRMSSITPFSYIHLFMPMLHPFKFYTKNTLSSRINDLIFESIQDPRFLPFRPSSIAGASIICALEEMHPTQFNDQKALLLYILPLQSKVELMNCHGLMIELYSVECAKDGASECSAPRSPMGVLDASFSSNSITSCINSQTSQPISSTFSPSKWRTDNEFS